MGASSHSSASGKATVTSSEGFLLRRVLSMRGDMDRNLSPGFTSTCQLCRGTGRYVREGKVYFCNCYLHFVLAQKMRQAGFNDPEHHRAQFDLMPDVIAKYTSQRENVPAEVKAADEIEAMRQLYEFRPIAINEFLRQYSDKILQELPNLQKHRNVLLYGTTGSGKTYAAAAVARRLFLYGYTPQFTTMENLVQIMRRATSDDRAERKLQTLLHAPLLVLDEIGYEYRASENDYTLSKITDFLRYRYRAKLPIIGTSNLLLTELESRYHADNMSILHEYVKIWLTKIEDHRLTRGRTQMDDYDDSIWSTGDQDD